MTTRPMQDKILGAITDIIKTFGYEAVERRESAFVGTIYAQPRGRFNTLARISYDFRSDYCMLNIDGLDYRLDYAGGATIDLALDRIRENLAKAAG